MFASKAGTYHSEAPFTCSSLGYAPILTFRAFRFIDTDTTALAA